MNVKDLIRAGQLSEAVAAMREVIALEEARGNVPAHPNDRRTFHIGLPRRPKHFVEVYGRLQLRDGKSPVRRVAS